MLNYKIGEVRNPGQGLTDDEFESNCRQQQDEGQLQSVLRFRQLHWESRKRQTADEKLKENNL